MEQIPSEVPTQEVARLQGIRVSVSLDPDWPLLIAEAQGFRARYLLFGGEFVGHERLPNEQQRSLEEWLAKRDPVWKRTVAYLAYDQWLKARNGRTVESLPDPAQLLPRNAQPTEVDGCRFYRIARGWVLPGYKLEVGFHNGEIRTVDVHRMRGDSPLFRGVFERFDQAVFTPFHVEWPDAEHDNTIEIENQDLWAAGEPSFAILPRDA